MLYSYTWYILVVIMAWNTLSGMHTQYHFMGHGINQLLRWRNFRVGMKCEFVATATEPEEAMSKPQFFFRPQTKKIVGCVGGWVGGYVTLSPEARKKIEVRFSRFGNRREIHREMLFVFDFRKSSKQYVSSIIGDFRAYYVLVLFPRCLQRRSTLKVHPIFL